jgi:hypothetical protein
MSVAVGNGITRNTQRELREWAFTRDNFRNRYIDHVFSHSPTLSIFASQTLGDFGGVALAGEGHRVEMGGHAIVQPVVLGEHAGADRVSGPYGIHNVSPDDNVRMAEATWKFYNHGLVIADHETRINSGDAARASFIEHQTRQVMLAMANLIGDDLFNLSTPTDALTSLDDLISANDSVQGLSGATYTQYNARGVSAIGTAPGSISFASGAFSSQGLADMRTGWNNASEGLVQPTVLITDYATHERYEGALQPQERFSGPVAVADGSFSALAFKSTPVLPDRKCNAGYMYFLRIGEEGIQFVALQGADFDFGDFKPSSNQTVQVSPLEVTCNLVIGNRQYGSNKLTGITD